MEGGKLYGAEYQEYEEQEGSMILYMILDTFVLFQKYHLDLFVSNVCPNYVLHLFFQLTLCAIKSPPY